MARLRSRIGRLPCVVTVENVNGAPVWPLDRQQKDVYVALGTVLTPGFGGTIKRSRWVALFASALVKT
jgi:hypothetical protein